MNTLHGTSTGPRRGCPGSATCSASNRRGSILVIVLVVVVMLALGCYTFSETMMLEREATVMYGRGAQARAMADSGIEMAAALLGDPEASSTSQYYHMPELFQGVLMRDAEAARGRGRFSLIAPVEGDPTAQSVRFGLIDESGKLNVNAILTFELDEIQSREMLMWLPDMTEDVADSILDWIDEDEEQRPYGAESDYYATFDPPYTAANRPIESLDELLQVAGVTPWLLFGEDANRNGLLDPNEDDGEDSAPADNADGILQLGWSAYLTVYSREQNLRADGSSRINVNHGTLTELYDMIEQEFSEDEARFIVAYRLYGPYGEEETDDPNQPGQGETGGSNSESRGGGNRNSGGSGAPNQQAEEQLRGVANQVAGALFGSGGDPPTRGGLKLGTAPPEFQLKSLYELVGSQVQAEIDGVETILESPWSGEPGDMLDYLPDFLDAFTLTDDPFIEGRININQARFEVLMGVPEMTEGLAMDIVGSQMVGATGEPLDDATGLRSTTGWLVIEGLTDLPTLRKLDPYLTARGDVYRVQSVGFFEAGGPFSRLEAVIDATQIPPRVVFLRDLTQLGQGYSKSMLLSGSGGF